MKKWFEPKTICLELISVIPLDKPTGKLFYLDYKYYKQKETLRVGKINKN